MSGCDAFTPGEMAGLHWAMQGISCGSVFGIGLDPEGIVDPDHIAIRAGGRFGIESMQWIAENSASHFSNAFISALHSGACEGDVEIFLECEAEGDKISVESEVMFSFDDPASGGKLSAGSIRFPARGMDRGDGPHVFRDMLARAISPFVPDARGEAVAAMIAEEWDGGLEPWEIGDLVAATMIREFGCDRDEADGLIGEARLVLADFDDGRMPLRCIFPLSGFSDRLAPCLAALPCLADFPLDSWKLLRRIREDQDSWPDFGHLGYAAMPGGKSLTLSLRFATGADLGLIGESLAEKPE